MNTPLDTPSPLAASTTTRPPLVRVPRAAISANSTEPRPFIAGVCVAIARHFATSVTAVRVLFACTAAVLVFPAVVLYMWLWAMLPVSDGHRHYRTPRLATALREPTLRRRVTAAAPGFLAAALFFLLTIAVIGASHHWWGISRGVVVGVLAVIGVVMVWSQTSKVAQWRSPSFLMLTGVGTVFIVAAVALLMAWRLAAGEFIVVMGYAIILVAVVAAVIAPLWIAINRELHTSLITQTRESERADIAAHLHDSVLQTLVLIKNRADDPALVRSLALTQERELRSWLYTGRSSEESTVADAVRRSAASIEGDYGVEIEVVAVGDCDLDANEMAIVAAANEAMKNAVRHGAPPVRVYCEVSATNVDVFVTDRGSGFDVDTIDADRHGVRDSIIGRIERLRGSVEIRRLNPGTEIHMRTPRTHPVGEELP